MPRFGVKHLGECHSDLHLRQDKAVCICSSRAAAGYITALALPCSSTSPVQLAC